MHYSFATSGGNVGYSQADSEIRKNDRTATVVEELSEKEKIDELSRMITGTKLTETAKEHAREMLALASNYKQSTQ